jgi:nitrate/nitrite transport system substrate-binding protein
MAAVMEFDKKYGIKIIPSKEASWAAVRDKLGQRRARRRACPLRSHLRRAMGLGGPKKDMNILMNLNHNGQAFTLSRKLYDKGVRDCRVAEGAHRQGKGEYTFAQTFPTGTHAMWIYYWLAAHGIIRSRTQGDRRSAAADGGQHARRQHGRLLRRRAVDVPRRHGQDRASPANTTQDLWKDHPRRRSAAPPSSRRSTRTRRAR